MGLNRPGIHRPINVNIIIIILVGFLKEKHPNVHHLFSDACQAGVHHKSAGPLIFIPVSP